MTGEVTWEMDSAGPRRLAKSYAVLTVAGKRFTVCREPIRVEAEGGGCAAYVDPALRLTPRAIPELRRGVTVYTDSGCATVTRPRFGLRLRDRSLHIRSNDREWTVQTYRRRCVFIDVQGRAQLCIVTNKSKYLFSDSIQEPDICLIALIVEASWPWTGSLLFWLVQGI